MTDHTLRYGLLRSNASGLTAFTLIEVLIAVAMCMALAGAATAAYVHIDRTTRRQQAMQEMTLEVAHAYHRWHALGIACASYTQIFLKDSTSMEAGLKLRDNLAYNPSGYRAVAWKFAVPSPADLTRGLGVDDLGPEAWACLEFREYTNPIALSDYQKYGKTVGQGRYVSRFGKLLFGRSSGHYFYNDGQWRKTTPSRTLPPTYNFTHMFSYTQNDATACWLYDLTYHLAPAFPPHYWVFRYDNNGGDSSDDEDASIQADFPFCVLYSDGTKYGQMLPTPSTARPVAIRLRFRVTDDPTPDTIDDRSRYAEQRIDLTIPLTSVWGSTDAP